MFGKLIDTAFGDGDMAQWLSHSVKEIVRGETREMKTFLQSEEGKSTSMIYFKQDIL